jgi:simple sugar transport system ATP-binding protein
MDLPIVPVTPGAVLVEVDSAVVQGGRGVEAVRGVSLAVRAGEIYGIAGVEGNGQSELVEALVGLRPLKAGRLLLHGQDVTASGIGARRLLGLAHVPEDRHKRGLVLPMDIRENLILGHHTRHAFGRGIMLDLAAINAYAAERVRQFDVRTPSLVTPALALSGGNQQKVVVAREFSFEPRILIVSQHTRGLDIGATEFVRRQILEARSHGLAVLLVSAMLDEILSLSDRIGVMHAGRLVVELPRGSATPQQIGLYMTGAAPAEARSG